MDCTYLFILVAFIPLMWGLLVFIVCSSETFKNLIAISTGIGFYAAYFLGITIVLAGSNIKPSVEIYVMPCRYLSNK